MKTLEENLLRKKANFFFLVKKKKAGGREKKKKASFLYIAVNFTLNQNELKFQQFKIW